MGPEAAIVAAGFQAVSAIRDANIAKKTGQYNAAIARRNATVAEQQAAADVAAKDRERVQRLGAGRAAIGASGIQAEGSALDVLYNSASLFELDKQNIEYKGRLKALGYQDEAALQDASASAALTSGYLKAGGALLSGGSKYYELTAPPKPPKKVT